jgi:formylglycine-generating enzyme required for sulfatase activity
VPAGEFMMGSKDDSLAWPGGSETPRHRPTLDAYRISKYPITYAQYTAFVHDGGYTERWRKCWARDGWNWKGERTGPDREGGVFDLPNHPAVMITWYEAAAFCNWLGERSGLKVTLPSEAQWEKAARGTDGRVYPWGPELMPDHANYRETDINTTSAVGIFPLGASPYGVLDMGGNVWEWCLTKWREDYTTTEDNDPEGMDERVLRGGAFHDGARGMRCAVRNRHFAFDRVRYFGFRIVASPVS